WSIPEMNFCLFSLIDKWETNLKKITSEMADFLQALRQKMRVGVVGSSDFKRFRNNWGRW
uniref:Uncharacterized protein n=1 Tax=Naja naja TaxID=35670 RepID=A0A8C6Y6W9_NAJNA